MAASEAEKQPGAPEGESPLATANAGHAQSLQVAEVWVSLTWSRCSGRHRVCSEQALNGQDRFWRRCPAEVDQVLVPAPEVCWTQGEKTCLAAPVSELKEEKIKTEVEAPEERGAGPQIAIARPSHGPKKKPVIHPRPNQQAHPRAELELSPRLPSLKEESEGSQSEPSPSPKQHKKSKKRKSLGVPVLTTTAGTVSASLEALGLERKAQRVRPLYQYINYSNPELNQADEEDREVEAQAKSELVTDTEEARLEQLQTFLPVTGEPSSGLTLPCPSMLVTPAQALVLRREEAVEEPRGLLDLGTSVRLKAEVDKSTQVDIDKILSVCTAPLVPPLSPQYK
ncbi:uncharacterized protein C16orf86 homolog [Suncus etruscus]|uniref:uncharacterized protein C16orf86 homolog n=1 Tax=Suncus etruscus TaxID=109475 RepID=UPI0021108017|nr:uncharacterized protein C16orf86 homolog [Suncus etruscus]